MGEIKQNPRQAELLAKFQQGIQKNYSWFKKYAASIPQGEPMPYHPNFEMDEEEYNELMALMESNKTTPSEQEELVIVNENELITFQSQGKLKAFEDLKINLEKKEIRFKNQVLQFDEAIHDETIENEFKSKWKGYRWVSTSIDSLDAQRVVHVEFVIGQLEDEGKIYMEVKEKIINNERVVSDLFIPVLF